MRQLIFLNLFLISSFSLAQSGSSSDTVPIEAPGSTASSFGVSLETTSFSYQESHMKDSGTLNGFNVFGKYKFSPSFSLNGNLNYLQGGVQYDGQLMSGTPIKTDEHYDVLDLAANGEFLTELSQEVNISFLVGLGRRVTTDANDPNPYDYKRIHTYNYYSLMGQIVIPHNEKSATTTYLGIESMLSGHVQTYLSDVDPRLPDLDMKFDGGSAFKLGISHSRKFDFGTVFAGVNYKKWTLNKSELSQPVWTGSKYEIFVEPQNTTTVIALDAGLVF